MNYRGIEIIISDILERIKELEQHDNDEFIFIDLDRISRECYFNEYLNGDKVLYHLDKPLLLLKPIRFEQIKNDDGITLEVIQEYKKLNFNEQI